MLTVCLVYIKVDVPIYNVYLFECTLLKKYIKDHTMTIEQGSICNVMNNQETFYVTIIDCDYTPALTSE